MVHQTSDREGEEIQVFGDGQQVRGFNYVDDVVDASARLPASNDRLKGRLLQSRRREEPLALEEFVKIAAEGRRRWPPYRIVRFPAEKKVIRCRQRLQLRCEIQLRYRLESPCAGSKKD